MDATVVSRRNRRVNLKVLMYDGLTIASDSSRAWVQSLGIGASVAKHADTLCMIYDRSPDTSPGFPEAYSAVDRQQSGIPEQSICSVINDRNFARTSWHLRLEAWSDGGLGMNISGNVQVDRRYLEAPRNVSLEKDTPLEPSSGKYGTFST